MATFIPEARPEDIIHDSERIVFEALRRLPNGYVVLHSFPWLRPNRDLAGEPLREGEADFVIIHPERGLLVVEVKGGNPKLEGRTWVRAGKEMRDPFDQARRNRYALLEAVEERTRRRLHKGQFAHGDLVIFPHARYRGPLPLNTDSRVIMDASGLEEIVARVEAAFAAWTKTPTRLSAAQLSELLEALMPKLRLLRCAGAALNAEQQRIVQITLDQRATLLGLLENDRVLVEGTAGSGKTQLALEFALSLADRGGRVLFLCYNRHLASWLQEQSAHDLRSQRGPGSLNIATFHSFALSLARRAKVEFEVPADGAQEFWDNEVPLILEQAQEVLSTRGDTQKYDAVVVDEAQDFAPDWWVPIESLTKGGHSGKVYVFLDLNQSLRREATYPPIPLPAKFRLTTNCRNTKTIAQSASTLAKIEIRLLPGSPMGEMPGVRRTPSTSAEAGLVLAEVRHLLDDGIRPEQIVLIGPASHDKGPLARHREVEDVPLIEDAIDWRRGAGVLVTTARSFKGLEADVVILFGLSAFGGLFTVTDLYVAWTRAKHRLVLICQPGEVRSAIESALADAERFIGKDLVSSEGEASSD